MDLRLLTYAEQVAAHLRSELLKLRWVGELPGANRLGAELGVNHTTIDSALRLLEEEGLLVSQGAGRPRRIELPKDGTASARLQVGLLLFESADKSAYDTLELRRQLMEAGHAVIIPNHSMTELNMDLSRISRMVSKSKVDAWVVFSGPGEVLSWLAKQPTPVFDYSGQKPKGIPMASVGPAGHTAIVPLVRRLVLLGHRRIVWLARFSDPNYLFKEMEKQGIPVGSYTKPSWEPTPSGFRNCLDSLFATTPPTALLIDEAPLFLAAQLHLARRGILAPEHVSLYCTDPDPAFEWCEPSVAHTFWDRDPAIRRMVRWVANVSRGKEDFRATETKVEF